MFVFVRPSALTQQGPGYCSLSASCSKYWCSLFSAHLLAEKTVICFCLWNQFCSLWKSGFTFFCRFQGRFDSLGDNGCSATRDVLCRAEICRDYPEINWRCSQFFSLFFSVSHFDDARQEKKKFMTVGRKGLTRCELLFA